MAEPSDLFERITRLDNLEAAWERVKENAGGAGGDGQTIQEFEIDLPTRLVRLQQALRLGTYRPGPVRRVEIPKESGGLRGLAIPCVVDRVAQGAVQRVLTPLLDGEMEEASYAYRPGRSVQMAVAKVSGLRKAGYTWVVDGDIERFFDQVPHELVIERLRRSVADEAVVGLIELWLESVGTGGRGLPQGSPISPLLANLHLDAIDERIERRGVRLVRFADDFLLMCRSQPAAEKARAEMATLLEQHGLRLHPDKTRIVPFEKGFRFLGHLFVRSMVLKEVEVDESGAPAGRPHSAPLPVSPMTGAAVATEPKRAPGLRVLYVTEPGRRVGVRNQAFTVVDGEAELIAIPPDRIDRIELWPGVTIADAAMRHAVSTDTAVALVDGHGETLGTLVPPAPKRARLHLAQARHCWDPDLRRDLARRLVAGRLHNQRALLRRLNRQRNHAEVVDAVLGINRTLRKLVIAADVDALMGYEGEGAKLYWPALGLCLEHGWKLRFRRRRPPPDPVNLVLSFLAALLYRDVAVLVGRHGLHPGFGALHASRDGQDGAAFDLMEEFRAPLVEGLCVYLFNNRMLQRPDFSKLADGGCRIGKQGRDAVVRGYEAWLDRPVKSPRTGEQLLWRRLIEEQAMALVRHVEGETPYQPYKMDY